jgi:hypothetical protein
VRKDDPPAAIVPTDEGGGRSEAAGARPVDAAAERAREREGGPQASIGTSRRPGWCTETAGGGRGGPRWEREGG